MCQQLYAVDQGGSYAVDKGCTTYVRMRPHATFDKDFCVNVHVI